MTLDEALEGRTISGAEAVRELKRHGVHAIVQDDALMALEEFTWDRYPGRVFHQWTPLELSSRAVLEFLGY